MRVKVYRNLRFRDRVMYSVQSRGRVVERVPEMTLSNVTLTVSEAGRQRVLREKRKNVHAFVVGEPEYEWEGAVPRSGWIAARYNPYLFGSFVVSSTGVPIHKARWAKLDEYGLHVIP